MVEAVATAKARLRAEADTVKPAASWGYQRGEELVVRGTNGRRTQIARARLKQWTPRAEARFLATLAATCNVKAACAAAGLTAASAYAHRQRWPAFAKAWDVALEEGYLRVSTALVESACRSLDPGGMDFPADTPIPPMIAAQAIHVLHMHKARVHGIGKRPGAGRRPRSLDEVRASILRKFEAIETMRLADERVAEINP